MDLIPKTEMKEQNGVSRSCTCTLYSGIMIRVFSDVVGIHVPQPQLQCDDIIASCTGASFEFVVHFVVS